MFKRIMVLSVGILLACQSAFALMGTRPLGMGGAFTAVADDANALYWNPAGLALNPEVSLTGSTMLSNRNTWVGDNVANLKMCYEADMSPFEWIMGVGLASAVALEGAKYFKKNWGREGERPSREEAVTAAVQGTGEAVSLKKELKELAKKAVADTKETAKEVVKHTRVNVNIGLFPWGAPWYRPDDYRPNYWEQPVARDSTKAQFALGVGWLNDYNPPLDQKSNWYTLSIASGFEQRIAIGAGVNFYDLTKISTDTRGIGADLDLGFIARPVQYITVGLVTKGLLTTDFNWQNGQKTRGYEMLVNAGVSIKPTDLLTLAADIHNALGQNNKAATLHFGAETVLLPGLLARAGWSDNSKTAGLSLALGNLIIDYAILGGSYNRTQMLGAAWRF